MTNILLAKGRVVDPSQGIDAVLDVLIQNGKIASLAESIHPESLTEVVDCTNLIICPGLIDMHVHLREPGKEEKETIRSGTRAAAVGGFTSILCKANTGIIVDSPEAVNYIYSITSRKGLVNVFPISAITVGLQGTRLTDLWTVAEAGAVAISDDGVPVSNPAVMRRALALSKDVGLLVMAHCEDQTLAGDGMVTESITAWETGLSSSPQTSEVVSIARDLALAKETGGKLHIDHISTRGSLEVIKEAKQTGVNVSCETCPHYFSLSVEAVANYSTGCKMNPPLRTTDDVQAIITGLSEGFIDVISTDHAPHTEVEKDRFFAEAPFGIVGLETALPLALHFLHHKHGISISQIVKLMSVNGARRLGLKGKGSLTPGSDADVTVFDLELQKTVDSSNFQSMGKSTPYDGMTLKGWPVFTFVAGELVAKDGKIIY